MRPSVWGRVTPIRMGWLASEPSLMYGSVVCGKGWRFRVQATQRASQGRTRLTTCCAIGFAIAGSACIAVRPDGKSAETPSGLSSDYGRAQAQSIVLDSPSSAPAERDDRTAPVVRVAVFGTSSEPVGVPYLYGYPLYAEGTALQGVRLMRQDNWAGIERTEQEGEGGVVRVVEKLPALECEFIGIQEDIGKYVPLSIQCDLPSARGRNGGRPAVGEVTAGARSADVLSEPTLSKAFLGEFHAQTPGLDAGDGTGYFDTPSGLLGFEFKNDKLVAVSFLFSPPQTSWRTPELWNEPIAYGAP